MVTLTEIRTPVALASWNEVLAADPRSIVTQTPTWAACVCSTGRFEDVSRLYRFDDGRRIVIPLARRRGIPPRWAPQASWPFDWGIGGPIADGPVCAEHTRAVFTDLAANGALRVSLRTGPAADAAWDVAPEPYVRSVHHSYELDLSAGFDDVWRTGFRGSVRRAVRKAERTQLHVETDTSGALVRDFDRLYRLSLDRWAQAQHEPRAVARWRGARANPRHKFQAVADRFGDRCAVWIAYLGTRPAAGIIVLRHGTNAKYWRGAMDAELAAPLRANDLLHKLAIEAACAAGCSAYHMGDSRPGSGLARFKAGFGARECAGSSYRAERFPLTAVETKLRDVIKSAIRFRDL